MYGLDKATAETKAAELAKQYPMNKYEVAAHSWTVTGIPLTWGVKKYVPYIGTTFKLDGFVWFPRNFSTLSPR